MRVSTLLTLALLVFVPVARAEEKEAPRGGSPQLWLASASQQDGQVVIQLAEPVEQGGAGGQVVGPGVRSLPATTVMKWRNLPRVTLGKTAQAFRVDGKPAEPDAVLKALARPRGVAVFVRTNASDPARPDPFYLALLREETLVLVVNHKDLYPAEP
jgi:hypothetical protein